LSPATCSTKRPKVLRYPRFRKFHTLNEEGIYQYIAFLRDVAEIVTLDPTLTVPIRDVNDIIVAQTAILGEADILCTMDDDFYDPVLQQFLGRFGITVMNDVQLIHRIGERK
jgi:putative PIN family toxin of toxin-antitoxin system